MAEPDESMLNPKYLGGLIGGQGYAFQNAYVLYRLAGWLIDPAFAGVQPEGWDDVEVFFQDEAGGRRREAIQVKDHPVTPAEARKILAEFQRRARRGTRDGIDYGFRLACTGLSAALGPVEKAAKLLQARSGYSEAETAATRAELAAKVEALGLEAPGEFVAGVEFEADLGGVTREAVLRDVVTMGLYRGGYGLSVVGAEYAYVQLAAALNRWLQEARYVPRADVEEILRQEAVRHPEPPLPAEDGATYTSDVVLSYAPADGSWVRGVLVPRLEAAGLKPCARFEGCGAGAELRQAVQGSRRTLLVLSPAYLAGDWPAFEKLMLGAWDRAARADRLVLARRADCRRPLLVGYLPYVDLAAPGDAAWRALLAALGVPRAEEPPDLPAPPGWRLAHPFLMPPHFTGRLDERRRLSAWLDGDAAHPLLAVRALGGFGKSALAWHWLLHDVAGGRWPRVLWWGFYDDRDFAKFVAGALGYLHETGATQPGGASHPGDLNPRQQVDALLDALRPPGTLLVLDGFERALRAYGTMDAAYRGDEPGAGLTDCVSPPAEHFLRCVATLPGLRGKVLLTTRLRPRAVETHGGELLAGCDELALAQMAPADAVGFFRARGVRGARAEIEAACAPYGYHPLSLRLLAGLVMSDPRRPGDVAAARRLDVMGDLKARQHHVLETAYTNLDAGEQRLLSTLACFRGAVGYETLAAVARQTSEVGRSPKTSEVGAGLDAALRALVDRGLVHRDRKTGRYDLHPIVRRYAYDRLGGAARAEAHGQLRDYFAAVPPPERVETLDDLAPAIELYHHTVRAGQYDEACDLFYERINKATYYQLGAYQLRIELLRALFPDGEGNPPRLKDESDQAWTLNALAGSYAMSGRPRRAVPLVEQHNAIYEKQGDRRNLVSGLGNLATQQMITGALRAAEANLRRLIALGREIEDELGEAVGHQELGRLLAYRGDRAGAEEALAASSRYWEHTRDVQGLFIDEAYRALRALLLARHAALAGEPLPDPHSPISLARKALELADETARVRFPVERDYVRAHWLLGAAHRAAGDLDAAERHLSEALTRCRGINAVDAEADVLLDLARLRRDQGQQDEARRLAEEALLITERSGYVLQGADAHLFLAALDTEAGEREKARDQARAARALATCDGPPAYTYKVAYEEAGALLARPD